MNAYDTNESALLRLNREIGQNGGRNDSRAEDEKVIGERRYNSKEQG